VAAFLDDQLGIQEPQQPQEQYSGPQFPDRYLRW
jgi:hypothetical protein